jgi:TRAP-type C4-dicarboxylate transport system substrate-binding protein
MKNAWDELTDNAKGKVTDNGGEVYVLSEAEHTKLVEAAEKVTQQWISENGDKGQQLYDKIIELSAS